MSYVAAMGSIIDKLDIQKFLLMGTLGHIDEIQPFAALGQNPPDGCHQRHAGGMPPSYCTLRAMDMGASGMLEDLESPTADAVAVSSCSVHQNADVTACEARVSKKGDLHHSLFPLPSPPLPSHNSALPSFVVNLCCRFP